MTALSKKTRTTLLIVAGAILLTALLAVWGVIMVNTLTRHRLMNSYLAPYSERATAYLAENEAFTETYGEVTLHVKSYTYSYLDSAKIARPPFGLGCPATAEEFEAELAYLTIEVRFSAIHSVNVRFEKTPDGSLEITGWENADE